MKTKGKSGNIKKVFWTGVEKEQNMNNTTRSDHYSEI
jgi:hypothetical protein